MTLFLFQVSPRHISNPKPEVCKNPGRLSTPQNQERVLTKTRTLNPAAPEVRRPAFGARIPGRGAGKGRRRPWEFFEVTEVRALLHLTAAASSVFFFFFHSLSRVYV